MSIPNNNNALIIIDVQKAYLTYDSVYPSHNDVINNINKLLTRWRAAKAPIIHIRHASKHSDSPYHSSAATHQFVEQLAPLENETVITKYENCAFIGTNLQETLEQLAIEQLTVTGVLINHSVDATIRYAAGQGFDINLPASATSAMAIKSKNGVNATPLEAHSLLLANLDEEYCTLV